MQVFSIVLARQTILFSTSAWPPFEHLQTYLVETDDEPAAVYDLLRFPTNLLFDWLELPILIHTIY